ncbi:MAG: 3-oxoacyl-ACP reductase [Verrucomicrobia bacterium]|nr:3-oxoacyl-ACP reductase [Verrucomicrobiota bacterium]
MKSSPSPEKTILIVGASRGLGLGLAREYLARGWRVIATVRLDRERLIACAGSELLSKLEIETLDTTLPAQIAALRERLAGRQIDVLVVNAGVMSRHDEKIGEISEQDFNWVMVTNALSPMRIVEEFSGLVPESGAIVVMSSAMGSITRNTTGGAEVYRASKAALNTLMRSFASRQTKPRTLLAMHPGWVRTEMGSDRAPLDVETSVRGMVKVIDAEAGKPGMRFVNYKGETVEW